MQKGLKVTPRHLNLFEGGIRGLGEGRLRGVQRRRRRGCGLFQVNGNPILAPGIRAHGHHHGLFTG